MDFDTESEDFSAMAELGWNSHELYGYAAVDDGITTHLNCTDRAASQSQLAGAPAQPCIPQAGQTPLPSQAVHSENIHDQRYSTMPLGQSPDFAPHLFGQDEDHLSLFAAQVGQNGHQYPPMPSAIPIPAASYMPLDEQDSHTYRPGLIAEYDGSLDNLLVQDTNVETMRVFSQEHSITELTDLQPYSAPAYTLPHQHYSRVSTSTLSPRSWPRSQTEPSTVSRQSNQPSGQARNRPKFVPARKWSPSRIRTISHERRPKTLPSRIPWDHKGRSNAGMTREQIGELPIEALVRPFSCVKAVADPREFGHGAEIVISVGSRTSHRTMVNTGHSGYGVNYGSTPFKVVVTGGHGSVVFTWDWSWDCDGPTNRERSVEFSDQTSDVVTSIE